VASPQFITGLAAVAGLAGSVQAFRRFRRGFLPILAYHAITDDPHERDPQIVHRSQFERQMRWLVCNGYQAVACSGLLQPVANCQKRVGISFDDGFASVHRLALPILQEMGLPATIFLSTDYVGQGKPFPWDYADNDPPLSWAQVDALRRGGLEVGSHAASHRHLPALTDGELVCELRDSRRIIEEATGEEIRLLAYPHGAFDERVKRAAECAGYKAAFAVRSDPATADRFSISRIVMRNQTSMAGFRLRMWGMHSFIKYNPAFGLVRPLLRHWRYAFL
jgi:peptidoglycan/xylan/chitin deacetylase (PgdA/CDA1 family)